MTGFTPGYLYSFLKIVIREVFDDQLPHRSMVMTYITLLSIIPLLAILFSMFNLFGGADWFLEVLRPQILQRLTPGSGTIVVERIEFVLDEGKGIAASGISLLFLVGLVHAIFSSIESAFNNIWDVRSSAGKFSRVPLYWGMFTIIPILVGSSLALTTYIKALPLVSTAVEQVPFAMSLINRSLPLVMIMISFFLLYKFIPATRVKWQSALTGTILAGALYEVFKAGFIFYTQKVVQQDVIYGSLAVIPALMIWVNLSWIVVLTGVEICYVSQHFNGLIKSSKNIYLSQSQKIILACVILYQATLAFRGKRQPVTLEEWSLNYSIPPSATNEILDLLQKAGMIAKLDREHYKIVLIKDPVSISFAEIESLIEGERYRAWQLPQDSTWQWFETWYRQRRGILNDSEYNLSVNELVEKVDTIANVENHPGHR